MMERREALERIAAALERLAPPPSPPADWSSAPAFVWDGACAKAIDRLDALPLERLHAIDKQKAALTENLKRLAKGAAAHDVLLWGARGMGKSALIRAVTAAVHDAQPGALALVQVMPGALPSFPALLENLASQPRAFLIFIDDLGFGQGQHQDALALRSLLDGGLAERPARIRIAVTANQRAILARDGSETEAMHERDARDDALALADRFGLTLGFHPCERSEYLEILRGYTEPVGLSFDEEEALAWAIGRGNRSGRTAYQFAIELAGRAGIKL